MSHHSKNKGNNNYLGTRDAAATQAVMGAAWSMGGVQQHLDQLACEPQTRVHYLFP